MLLAGLMLAGRGGSIQETRLGRKKGPAARFSTGVPGTTSLGEKPGKILSRYLADSTAGLHGRLCAWTRALSPNFFPSKFDSLKPTDSPV